MSDHDDFDDFAENSMAHDFLTGHGVPVDMDGARLSLMARIKMAMRHAYNRGFKSGEHLGRAKALDVARKVAHNLGAARAAADGSNADRSGTLSRVPPGPSAPARLCKDDRQC